MYVYSQHGYSIPHSATSQWQSGLGTRVYSISELQPGDLVFFCDPSRSQGKACSHAGIYAGNGQIIHSSSSRSKTDRGWGRPAWASRASSGENPKCPPARGPSRTTKSGIRP